MAAESEWVTDRDCLFTVFTLGVQVGDQVRLRATHEGKWPVVKEAHDLELAIVDLDGSVWAEVQVTRSPNEYWKSGEQFITRILLERVSAWRRPCLK